MSKELVQQEILEINANLEVFKKAGDVRMLSFIGTFLGVIALVIVLAIQRWFPEINQSDKVDHMALLMVISCSAIAIAQHMKRKRAFNVIVRAALKLQMAGFQLYKKESFLDTGIAATEDSFPDGATPLNFWKLSAKKLHDIFYYD